MTSASDQDARPHKLSPLGDQMRSLREEVISEWGRRVRAQVDAAKELTEPVLVNTLPAFYDNLTEALTPEYPRTSASVVTPSVALEHGSERARITAYQVKSLIVEYQCLRSTILEVLQQHGAVLTQEQAEVIHASIDASIREAATAFVLAQSAFREQFVAALAHDLRGPLSNASISAQLIERTDDLAKIRRHAQKIGENIARVDQMIKELLDAIVFEHGERPHMQLTSFDIAEMVAQVREHMAVLHGPRFDVQGACLRGWWGRAELRRALENLVSNAIKYGAKDTPVRISWHSAHERVLLQVHNEGEPIPPDLQESVFQVFRRAQAAKDGDAQGWGIGLPYVRTVVESHGGSIDVDSSAERGTTFTMDMPVDARPFQQARVLGAFTPRG